MPEAGRKLTWRRRLAGLAVGTIACLVTFEIVLRAMHPFFKPQERASLLAPAPGERRILCMGDSNTYGVFIGPEDSYPGRLQRYLNRVAGQPWRVFNLGYPGQNTAQVRARLKANLEVYRPEILIVWAGVNNSWSPAMEHLWRHPDSEPTEAPGLFERSRALKALSMLVHEGTLMAAERAGSHFERGGGDVEGSFVIPGLDGKARGEGFGDVETIDPKIGSRQFRGDEVRAGIRTDLRRIGQICEENQVKLAVVCYFNEFDWIDDWINAPIVEFARESGTPLVPLTEGIRAAVAEFGMERLLFADGHATTLGNMEVARIVLKTLLDAGYLEQRAEWESVPSIAEVFATSHFDLKSFDGAKVEAELVCAPGWLYVVYLEALFSGEGSEEPRAVRIPGPLLHKVKDWHLFSNNLDQHGFAQLVLHTPRRSAIASLRQPGERLLGWRFQAHFWPPDGDLGTNPAISSPAVEVLLDQPFEWDDFSAVPTQYKL